MARLTSRPKDSGKKRLALAIESPKRIEGEDKDSDNDFTSISLLQRQNNKQRLCLSTKQFDKNGSAEMGKLRAEIESLKAILVTKNDDINILNSQVDQVKNTLTCIICVSLFNEPYTIECGHTFCYGCIRQWLEFRKVCPTCRHDVKKEPIQALSLRDQANILGEKEKNAVLKPTDTTDIWDGLFTSVPAPTLIQDTDDAVNRCAQCGWEIVEGICINCAQHYSGDEAGVIDSQDEFDADSPEPEPRRPPPQRPANGQRARAQRRNPFILDEAEADTPDTTPGHFDNEPDNYEFDSFIVSDSRSPSVYSDSDDDIGFVPNGLETSPVYRRSRNGRPRRQLRPIPNPFSDIIRRYAPHYGENTSPATPDDVFTRSNRSSTILAASTPQSCIVLSDCEDDIEEEEIIAGQSDQDIASDIEDIHSDDASQVVEESPHIRRTLRSRGPSTRQKLVALSLSDSE
ncbi:E3 ubiquitin ligase [Basidiobolus ranarum]|uniref:E3 ubiquitin ligase n=1 Tax=Basidiobolus ranarum TaxID=34480 RepID=A0ABR2WU24_9FUNG